MSSDTQYAYLVGIRDFIEKKKGYLSSQVGNPEGEDKPNKKVCLLSMFLDSLLDVPGLVLRSSCMGSRGREDTLGAC